MNVSAREVIQQLHLAPLPQEGGFFRATWKAGSSRHPSGASAIYFLITPEDFSALHKLTGEEIWCHHAGDPAEQWQLNPHTGAGGRFLLGSDFAAGESAQTVVPAGTWQGTRLCPGGPNGWSLFTCLVSPAWDEAAFTLGDRLTLSTQFPAAAEIIRVLSR